MTLKDARELVGLSQAALERNAGLTSGTVHDIESGRNANPSYQTVASVVAALRDAGLKGLTAEALFPLPNRSSSEVV